MNVRTYSVRPNSVVRIAAPAPVQQRVVVTLLSGTEDLSGVSVDPGEFQDPGDPGPGVYLDSALVDAPPFVLAPGQALYFGAVSTATTKIVTVQIATGERA